MRLLLLLCFLLANTVSAQSLVEGLGKFKIGETTIKSLTELSNEPIKPATEFSDKITPDNSLVEFDRRATTDENLLEDCPYSYRVRLFFAFTYTIAGVEVSNMKLRFFDDTLYEIEFDHTEELEQALTIKYGKPKTQITRTPVKCVYKLTGRTAGLKNNVISKSTWPSAPSVVASYYSNFRYDANCEPLLDDLFHIYDPAKLIQAKAVEDTAKKAELVRLRNDKKRQLNDF